MQFEHLPCSSLALPCTISPVCPVITGSPNKLAQQLSRIEDELATEKMKTANLNTQLAAEQAKTGMLEAQAETAKAKLMTEHASMLQAEFQRGFKQAETLLTGIYQRVLPGSSNQ